MARTTWRRRPRQLLRRAAGRAALSALIAILTLPACKPRSPSIILATTTSVDDSGFLDSLLVTYRRDSRARVRPVVVGSGEALELGRRGDVDAILAHSEEDELRFMDAGHGERRVPAFANDFVLVGPPADPAGAAGATNVLDALARIASAGQSFVSRGDRSGTHRREQSLWAAVEERGVAARPATPHYLEAGLGMAETLRLASERRAYTLSDRATYALLAAQLDLAILTAGDAALVNEYSVLVVRGARNAPAAVEFALWLGSESAQARIVGFGAHGGVPLFRPISAEAR